MVWTYNHPNADPKGRPKLPDDLPPDMMVKRFFAKQYQWPPWVVGELSLPELEWFPILENAADDASEAISELEQARAERESKNKRY
jgi:hypothetical protein